MLDYCSGSSRMKIEPLQKVEGEKTFSKMEGLTNSQASGSISNPFYFFHFHCLNHE